MFVDVCTVRAPPLSSVMLAASTRRASHSHSQWLGTYVSLASRVPHSGACWRNGAPVRSRLLVVCSTSPSAARRSLTRPSGQARRSRATRTVATITSTRGVRPCRKRHFDVEAYCYYWPCKIPPPKKLFVCGRQLNHPRPWPVRALALTCELCGRLVSPCVTRPVGLLRTGVD
jgi:hypothetical protein